MTGHPAIAFFIIFIEGSIVLFIQFSGEAKWDLSNAAAQMLGFTHTDRVGAIRLTARRPLRSDSNAIHAPSGDQAGICAFPDVCMTPPENPATPPGCSSTGAARLRSTGTFAIWSTS